MRIKDRPVRVTAGIAGVGLAAAMAAVALIRRDRPLHAYGDSIEGELTVDAAAGIGIPLADATRTTPVIARTSRATSLTRSGPDIMGLAIRVEGHAGGDLLFASTGTGPLSRYVLRLHDRIDAGPLTTLLPLFSPSGAVQFAAFPDGPTRFTLAWSRPMRRRWTPFAHLQLGQRTADPGHFRPTDGPPTGLRAPTWVRLLRGPAYAVARALVRLPRA